MMRPGWRGWTLAAALLVIGLVALMMTTGSRIDPEGCWELSAGSGAPRGIFHPPPELVSVTPGHVVRPAGASRDRARVDTLFITRWRKDLRGRLVIEHTNTYRGVLMTLSGRGDTLRGEAHTFDDLAAPGARPRPWPVTAVRAACE